MAPPSDRRVPRLTRGTHIGVERSAVFDVWRKTMDAAAMTTFRACFGEHAPSKVRPSDKVEMKTAFCCGITHHNTKAALAKVELPAVSDRSQSSKSDS
jgi:hypothetical protein